MQGPGTSANGRVAGSARGGGLLPGLAFLAAAWFPGAGGAAGFNHPGILNNKAELDFLKAKVQAKAEPWNTAASRLASNRKGFLSYAAKPRAVVECGSYSEPDNGCSDETNDAHAAYAHALLGYVTGNEAHFRKAAEILDAWSAVLTDHTNANAFLQAGWTGSVFPRAAEILRAAYPAWPAANQARFANMLKNAFLAKIRNGPPSPGYNGNWHLTIIEAIMAIAVFTDDTASFRKGVTMWRAAVPAYFYLASDGPLPVRPAGTTQFDSRAAILKYWYDQETLVDGLAQETCRDIAHTQYGIAAAAAIAEMAYHQGLDLYAEQADRMMKAMEFHANLIQGAAAPSWLCGGALNLVRAEPTWEIAYNHYHNRMRKNLPLSQQVISGKVRPSAASLHMAWESMTHAELGNPGGFVSFAAAPAAGAAARRSRPLHRYPGGYLAWPAGPGSGAAYSLEGKARVQP